MHTLFKGDTFIVMDAHIIMDAQGPVGSQSEVYTREKNQQQIILGVLHRMPTGRRS